MIEINMEGEDTSPAALKGFPFTIEDIAFWVVRRKNGETIRYTIPDQAGVTRGVGAFDHRLPAAYHPPTYQSLARFCEHLPATPPVFQAEGIELRIADAKGTRAKWTEHDLVLDCGAVLNAYDMKDPYLSGDGDLVEALRDFDRHCAARVLKIKWDDRAAPPLDPTFWPALLAEIKDQGITRVLTSCQGGHGRSGTSLVVLMMLLSDYSPLDAITHLRAIHCSRAIESGVQHAYINAVGKMLGREENALEAANVKSFRERFMTFTSPHAIEGQARLKALDVAHESA